jgi:membrane-bound lytic murein transglycosylase A
MKIALLLSLISFAVQGQTLVTPTRALNETISFTDDLALKNMEIAIERQLAAFKRSAPKGQVKFGDKTYPATRLVESMELFKEITGEAQSCLKEAVRPDCMAQLSARINREFEKYTPVPAATEPGAGQEKATLFTAYFSPDLLGSRTPSARFKNPIYGLPARADLRSKTREQIDFEGALLGQGLELFWVEDSLFDIYILHVEGGGRARLQNADGSEEKIYLSYAAANGQRFAFISRYMVAQGMLPNGASIEAQERYIEENPHRAREIFASSPSYIFFKETKTEPLGVKNIPLTEGRSLAIDTRIYTEVGMITFVQADKPRRGDDGRPVYEDFSRFFISQDTGGAIRGNARCDLYMGYGEEAAYIAHNTKRMGRQIFLIKK